MRQLRIVNLLVLALTLCLPSIAQGQPNQDDSSLERAWESNLKKKKP
jgi:hypothetical protein